MYRFSILFFFVLYLIHPEQMYADENIYNERLALYKKTEAISNLPWYYLAAFDQYERNKEQNNNELVAISFPDELWYGIGNYSFHRDIASIQLFGGIGQDGDGDGIANSNNPEDVLFTAAQLLKSYGLNEDDIKISLWNYYHRDLSVKTIMNTAKVYKHFGTVDRKSTRLNSSHVAISYAVFCLKKKILNI